MSFLSNQIVASEKLANQRPIPMRHLTSNLIQFKCFWWFKMSKVKKFLAVGNDIKIKNWLASRLEQAAKENMQNQNVKHNKINVLELLNLDQIIFPWVFLKFSIGKKLADRQLLKLRPIFNFYGRPFLCSLWPFGQNLSWFRNRPLLDHTTAHFESL